MGGGDREEVLDRLDTSSVLTFGVALGLVATAVELEMGGLDDSLLDP
jgi:hypothetical protein